jgi:hypothetical protein
MTNQSGRPRLLTYDELYSQKLKPVNTTNKEVSSQNIKVLKQAFKKRMGLTAK